MAGAFEAFLVSWGRGSRGQKDDQVQLAELPAGVGPVLRPKASRCHLAGDEERPDGVVQWRPLRASSVPGSRSGGFSLLKKSRSAGAVRARSLEQACVDVDGSGGR